MIKIFGVSTGINNSDNAILLDDFNIFCHQQLRLFSDCLKKSSDELILTLSSIILKIGKTYFKECCGMNIANF